MNRHSGALICCKHETKYRSARCNECTYMYHIDEYAVFFFHNFSDSTEDYMGQLLTAYIDFYNLHDTC